MLKIIKKRRSIRRYKPKEIEKEKLNQVLKAAMLAPSSSNRRPWEFVVVKDPEVKEKLSKATPYASFAKDAPVVLVLCADEKKDPLWVEDLSIAAAYIYLEAVNQDLGTCFVQVRETRTSDGENSEEYVKRLIGAPEKIRVLCLLPLGYPAEEKEEHKKQEFEKERIHQEKF